MTAADMPQIRRCRSSPVDGCRRPAYGPILKGMTQLHPTLDGVDATRGDAFARWRILALRGSSRNAGATARLSLVACADINATTHLAEDIAWWEAPRSGPALADPGARLDVALSLAESTGPHPHVAVWARQGPNEPFQSDVDWMVATRQAAAIRRRPAPPLLVITRWGWQCLPHGTSRSWKRLRAAA